MKPALPLIVEALTAESFAPFGDVLETANAQHFPINAGTTTRYHDLAQVCANGEASRVLFNLFDGQAWHAPISITLLERHPLGSQAFYPLSDSPWLVIVAPDEGGVPGAPRAFRPAPGRGVNIAINTWHGVLCPLDVPSDYLVVDRGGDGNNLEEHVFDVPWLVVEN